MPGAKTHVCEPKDARLCSATHNWRLAASRRMHCEPSSASDFLLRHYGTNVHPNRVSRCKIPPSSHKFLISCVYVRQRGFPDQGRRFGTPLATSWGPSPELAPGPSFPGAHDACNNSRVERNMVQFDKQCKKHRGILLWLLAGSVGAI